MSIVGMLVSSGLMLSGLALVVFGMYQSAKGAGYQACQQEHRVAAEHEREMRSLRGRQIEQRNAQARARIDKKFDQLMEDAGHASSDPQPQPTVLRAPGTCFSAQQLRVWNDANAAVESADAAGGADAAVPDAASAHERGERIDPEEPRAGDAPVLALRPRQGGPGPLGREPERHSQPEVGERQ